MGLFKSDPEKKAQRQAQKDALRERTEAVTALCREQMGRMERMNIGITPLRLRRCFTTTSGSRTPSDVKPKG